MRCQQRSLVAVAAFDACGDGEVLHGAASTPSWLRGALGLAPGDAAERVRLARGTRALLSAPAEQLRDGAITYDHLRSIDRAVRFVPAAQQDEAVAVLTDLATLSSVGDVRTAGRHLRLVADPDGTLAECEQQWERRHLTLAPLLDGMTSVEGLLDAESAALLQPPSSPSWFRPVLRTSERRHSGGQMGSPTSCALPATTACCPWSAENDHTCRCSSPKKESRSRPAGPLAAGQLPQTPGGKGLLHPTSVSRIGCDAQILPVLVDLDGAPMALGRSQRLFSSHQRRLLALRDGGCRFPGCSRPPAYTDAHHVVPWSAGGATDIDNAVLLCRFHHRLVHEGGWDLLVNHPTSGGGGTVTFAGPRGQLLSSAPRGP